MKLKLLAASAVALCLLSLAARSSAMHALREAPAPSPVGVLAQSELGALAAIDGHLRVKLVRMARR